MTKKHIVNLDDFEDYVVGHEICGSYGRESNKNIIVETNVIIKEVLFKVNNYDKKEWFETLQEAIELYNSI